ncbi:Chemotaxis protein MotB [Serratia rubidaea]|uniref:Chemotaxis protein MotB n=1 Tax=Serratia rubidaea TaxID=61652 RepID=A0A4U9HNX2_SERRU|nr:Chemotaxis protein MotB [Serratia rubidaea]
MCVRCGRRRSRQRKMSGMKQNHPVVLVRKRKAHHNAHHGGSWKIAYADFMTAMMAFFLVMWLLAIASPAGTDQIAEYFRTPLKVALTAATRAAPKAADSRRRDDPTQQDGLVKKQTDAEHRRRRDGSTSCASDWIN